MSATLTGNCPIRTTSQIYWALQSKQSGRFMSACGGAADVPLTFSSRKAAAKARTVFRENMLPTEPVRIRLTIQVEQIQVVQR